MTRPPRATLLSHRSAHFAPESPSTGVAGWRVTTPSRRPTPRAFRPRGPRSCAPRVARDAAPSPPRQWEPPRRPARPPSGPPLAGLPGAFAVARARRRGRLARRADDAGARASPYDSADTRARRTRAASHPHSRRARTTHGIRCTGAEIRKTPSSLRRDPRASTVLLTRHDRANAPETLPAAPQVTTARTAARRRGGSRSRRDDGNSIAAAVGHVTAAGWVTEWAPLKASGSTR